MFAMITQFPKRGIIKFNLVFFSLHSGLFSGTYLPSSSTITSVSLPKADHTSMLTERVPVVLMSSVVAPEKPASNTMGPKEVSADLTQL